MLHGCTIRDNALVGLGATILNGAVIGTNCLIGAGTLVPEGKEMPDGSLLIGMPVKVVRLVEERNVEMIREAAKHYQRRQREYRAGLAVVDR